VPAAVSRSLRTVNGVGRFGLPGAAPPYGLFSRGSAISRGSSLTALNSADRRDGHVTYHKGIRDAEACSPSPTPRHSRPLDGEGSAQAVAGGGGGAGGRRSSVSGRSTTRLAVAYIRRSPRTPILADEAASRDIRP